MTKRWTVCLVRSHKWAKVPYPSDEGPAGYFLRCRRCGKENHDAGDVQVRGAFMFG